MNHLCLAGIVVLLAGITGCAERKNRLDCTADSLAIALTRYVNQLEQMRAEYGGAFNLPKVNFYLFGMGDRDKYLYRDGQLISYSTGKIFRQWSPKKSWIIPNAYCVLMEMSGEGFVVIYEDEDGIWIKEEGESISVEAGMQPLVLPAFKDHPYGEILRVLHQEILVNILNGKPLPNFFVYSKPWRRDAAMMAMVLEKTDNTGLIRDWVLALDDPYDHNNGQKQGSPESETDNLGQTLYLLSLFADKSHPLVPLILEEVEKCTVVDCHGKYIRGRSDFQEVPVYQTKWLVFGLNRLHIGHDYTIPVMADNYSSLFWWEFKHKHIDGDSWRNNNYPYIGWARDHFYGQKNGLISNGLYPLTWEIDASQADYAGMTFVDSVYVDNKISAPHTWHAAEAFLYVLKKH